MARRASGPKACVSCWETQPVLVRFAYRVFYKINRAFSKIKRMLSLARKPKPDGLLSSG